MPDNSWVQVYGVKSNVRAERAKGALDSNNIPSVLMPSALWSPGDGSGIDDDPAGTTGEINIIMVPREFREEAELVIEAVLGDDGLPLESR